MYGSGIGVGRVKDSVDCGFVRVFQSRKAIPEASVVAGKLRGGW